MKIILKFFCMLAIVFSFVEAREGCVIHFKKADDLKMVKSDNFAVAPVLVFDTKKGDFVDFDSVPKYQYVTKSRDPYGNRKEIVHYERKVNAYLKKNYFLERMHISPNERYIFIFGFIAKKPIFDNNKNRVDNAKYGIGVRGERYFRKVVCGNSKPPKKVVLTLREQNGFLQLD